MSDSPPNRDLAGQRILLIVSGGIAAYKALDLIRRLKERGARVRCILTAGGGQFVTPLALAALSEEKVYTDLFSLTDESEMGHIRLSREADLVVVAPATADIMAKMAAGIADSLATTVLLASDKPVLIAPAMNHVMWAHPATQANLDILHNRGVATVGPGRGDLACGEEGPGRMAETAEIVAAILGRLKPAGALSGLRALVTSGPTHEPIDPVRYIANRSSGKQGHAIAAALARRGAEVTLVSGPVALADPPGVSVVHVVTAEEMFNVAKSVNDVDICVCAAAVGDWRVADRPAHKRKKDGRGTMALDLVENPDILAALSTDGAKRPKLVIGFAAETEELAEHARAKRAAKGCDWILANDVGSDSGTFGGEFNRVILVTADAAEPWPSMSKIDVAETLVKRIEEHFAR